MLLAILFSLSFMGIAYYILDSTFGSGGAKKRRFDQRLKYVFSLGGEAQRIKLEKEEHFSDIEAVNSLLSRQNAIKKMNQMLAITGWGISVSLFMLICSFAGGCVYFICVAKGLHFSLAIVIAVIFMLSVPLFILRLKYKQYIERFSSQFPKALQIIKGALESGMGLSIALERVALDGPEPVNKEFKQIISEISLGSSISDAISSFQRRIPTSDSKAFAIGINIQQESGGNLTELMSKLEETIQTRVSMRKELRVLTAQARLSGIVMGMLPIVLTLLIKIINPTYFDNLTGTEIGQKVIIVTVLLLLFGYFLIHRLVSLKIVS